MEYTEVELSDGSKIYTDDAGGAAPGAMVSLVDDSGNNVRRRIRAVRAATKKSIEAAAAGGFEVDGGYFVPAAEKPLGVADAASALLEAISGLPEGREREIAAMHAESAFLWARRAEEVAQ